MQSVTAVQLQRPASTSALTKQNAKSAKASHQRLDIGCVGTAGAATNGTFRVVGNSGAVPVHALPFTNELVLFMQRGNNANGSTYNVDLWVKLSNLLSKCSVPTRSGSAEELLHAELLLTIEHHY